MKLKKHLKKWKILYGFLLFFILLIFSIFVPFMSYEPVSQSTIDQFSLSRFYHDEEGPDRAMLMETNQSAWDERIRLMNLAEDRIVMSTFDMRAEESTKDIAAMLLHKADEGVKVQILVDGVSGVVRMEGRELFYALSSHPNIEIKLYNRLNILQPWKSQGRMHDKYVIVDETAYILGGRNTFDYFIGEYETVHRSYDREVLIYNTEGSQGGGRTASSLYHGIWMSAHIFTKMPPLQSSLRSKNKLKCSMTGMTQSEVNIRSYLSPLIMRRRQCRPIMWNWCQIRQESTVKSRSFFMN